MVLLSAKRFSIHEIQVDHAGDIGLTYYRLYLYTRDEKYKKAAIAITNTLASKFALSMPLFGMCRMVRSSPFNSLLHQLPIVNIRICTGTVAQLDI